MNIQKRYIYAGILSGIAFIVLYTIVDFKWWSSIILSLGFYLGGTYIFKSKDIRVYDPQALAKYNFETSRLFDYKDRVKDKNIKEKLKSIVEHSQKLIEYLQTKPTNATPIYNSLDYYLSFATQRIIEYMKIEKVKEKTFTENQLILKMNVYLKEIDTELAKLNSQVIDSKNKAIKYEMKRFELLSEIDINKESEK